MGRLRALRPADACNAASNAPLTATLTSGRSLSDCLYGRMLQTVADAALFMDTTVGYSPRDANSLPHPNISYAETTGNYTSSARSSPQLAATGIVLRGCLSNLKFTGLTQNLGQL